MKRLLAFLLALAMIFSLGITAFAEDTIPEETTDPDDETTTVADGTITITNATYGETYRVYKLFDATILEENGQVTGYGYSIKPESQFFAKLFGADGTTENPYFVYNRNTGSVSKREGANDSELIKYLTAMVNDENNPFVPIANPVLCVEEGKNADNYQLDYTFDPAKHDMQEGNAVTFEGLDFGYYLITSSLGSTVTINSNTPNVEVIDKNQEPATDFSKLVYVGKDEEGNDIWEESNSADIGDEITYKIEFTATNYDGDKKIHYYQIHDDKGDAIWAEFNSIKVTVGGVELPRGYYLSQGGINTDTWEYLGDKNHPDSWDNYGGNKDREDAQWYLVHLGYDKFRVTIPWLEDHTLTDVIDQTTGNVTSYTLGFAEDADSLYESPSKVVVTYNSVVEPGAAIGSTSQENRFNKANASWTSHNETNSTPPDEVVTNVYGIGLLKDDSVTGKNLAGAKFRIYRTYNKDAENEADKFKDPVYVIPTDIDGIYIVDSLNTPGESVSGLHKDIARNKYAAYLDEYLNGATQDNYVVSQANGKLAIVGLEAGTYYLVEVDPPAGYNGLTEPVALTAGSNTRPFYIYADKDGNVADIQAEDGTYKEKVLNLTHTVVHNSKGAVLPSTGGEGRIMLITMGAIIAMGFAVLMITQKKMSVYRD